MKRQLRPQNESCKSRACRPTSAFTVPTALLSIGSAMFTHVDSRPSCLIDSMHTGRLSSVGLLSLFQCGCIAAAAYWLWLYSALGGWSLLPLAMSLLPHLAVSKAVAAPWA